MVVQYYSMTGSGSWGQVRLNIKFRGLSWVRSVQSVAPSAAQSQYCTAARHNTWLRTNIIHLQSSKVNIKLLIAFHSVKASSLNQVVARCSQCAVQCAVHSLSPISARKVSEGDCEGD